MALTLQSKFTKLQYILGSPSNGSIYFYTPDSTGHLGLGYIVLDWNLNGEPWVMYPETESLETIRSIASSQNGFQPPNDQTLEITFSGYPTAITSRELLDKYGYFDATLQSSVDNYWERVRMVADLQVFGDRSEDASGLVTHTSKIGRVPTPFTSLETTQNQNLADWMGTHYDGGFVIYLDVDENLGLTTTTIENHLSFLALRVWLTSIFGNLQGQTAPGGTLTTANFEDRTFITRVAGIQHTFEVDSVTIISVSAGIQRVIVNCNYVNSPSNQAAIVDHIRSQTVSIPRQTNGLYAPQGNVLIPHRQSKLIFPNDVELTLYEGSLAQHKNGTYNSLVGDNPIIREYDETLASTHEHDNGDPNFQSFDRWVPTPPEEEIVHLHRLESGNNRTVASRFYDPTRYAAPGTAIRKIFHNRRNAGDAAWVIKDWNGNELIRLRSEQRAVFLLTADRRGNGELFGEELPEKVIQDTSGLIGNLAQAHYFDFSTTEWGRPWLSPVTADGANHDLVDLDAFTLPTVENTEHQSWATNTAWAIRHSVVIDIPGYCDFYQSMNVESAAAGAISQNHYTRLYLIRGTTLSIIGVDHNYTAIAGEGDGDTYHVSAHNLRVLAGDILLPMLIYPKANTLNPGDVNVTAFRRNIELRPFVESDFQRMAA